MILVVIMILPSVVFATENDAWGNPYSEFGSFDQFNANDPITIGVTTPDMDNIGAILTNLGIVFQVIPPSQLRDLNLLRQFDAVFINCSGNPGVNAIPSAPALRQFVSEGGVLYASDLAAPLLSESFPGIISFTGNSPSGNVQANIVSTGLAAHMGRNHLNVILPGSGLIIDQITPQATIYLERSLAFSSFVDDDVLTPIRSECGYCTKR